MNEQYSLIINLIEVKERLRLRCHVRDLLD